MPTIEQLKDCSWESLEVAILDIKEAAKASSQCLAIKDKRPNATYPLRVIWRCAKGRTFKSRSNYDINDQRRRNTTSQMEGCPYKVQLTRKTIQDPWIFIGSTTDKTSTHNHGLLKLEAFSQYRFESIKQHKVQIISLYNAGLRPAQIAEKMLSKDAITVSITAKDITNLIQLHMTETLQGRSRIEWLFDQLNDQQFYIHRERHNEHNRLQCLLIVPQSGLELYSCFHQVFLGDCTYKTNRFNMPLFNVCGVTHTKKTFQIAAAFLDKEDKEAFSWVLDQLHQIFKQHHIRPPNVTIVDRDLALINALKVSPFFDNAQLLLCRWHVSMNIVAKCKGSFPKATRDPVTNRPVRHPQFVQFLVDCNKLLASATELQYKQHLAHLEEKYIGKAIAAVSYVKQTWLNPWKEHIISCYINKYRHFGHQTTSVVEGLHATFKRSLWSRTGDLTFVFQALDSFWKVQKSNIQILQSIRMNKISTATLQPLYSGVRNHISFVALQLMLQEHQTLKKDLSKAPKGICPCPLAITHGIPCRHRLWQGLKYNNPLATDDFDPYWLWQSLGIQETKADMSGNLLPFEPLIVRTKGRPKGALGLERPTSIQDRQRDPSLFEIVQGIEAQEAMAAPPPSTAPAVLSSNTDRYEPGTEAHRAYLRSTESLSDLLDDVINDNSIIIEEEEYGDLMDCIVVQTQEMEMGIELFEGAAS